MLTASDGEEALRISRKFVRTIDILVSDIVMPKLDGLALCKQVLRERPTMKVLLPRLGRGRARFAITAGVRRHHQAGTRDRHGAARRAADRGVSAHFPVIAHPSHNAFSLARTHALAR